MSTTTPLASSPVPAELLGPDRPLLPKLHVDMEEEDGKLKVLLTVPLDPSVPAEKTAMDLAKDGQWLEILHCPEDVDLAAEREALSQRIATAYRTTEAGAAMRKDPLQPINDDHLREAFMPVAVQGASLWRRLISPVTKRLLGYSEGDRAQARAALSTALRRAYCIVVKSPVSLFPWAFLYDPEGLNKDDLSTLDFGRFWGLRHEIQEQIPGLAKRRTLPAAPRVVAAISKDVDPQGEHRASALAKAKDVDWVTSADALRGKLVQFDGDCFYFYGHALQQDPPTPTTSALKLDGFSVTVEELQSAEGPKFSKDLVFAFLNGCGTTPLNQWNTSSFAGLFCLNGDNKVCCVATFAEVPAAFARIFAARFWKHFLDDRERLGAALLLARQEMMRDFNHPMGLLYGLFGKIETQLAP